MIDDTPGTGASSPHPSGQPSPRGRWRAMTGQTRLLVGGVGAALVGSALLVLASVLPQLLVGLVS